MMALITAKLTKRAVSVKFQHKSGNITDHLEGWETIQRELLIAAVESKAAKLHCYSGDKEFRLENVLKSTLDINSMSHAGYVYSSVFCDLWLRCDLEAVASSEEFELSQLWVQFYSSDAFKQSTKPSTSLSFFELVNPVVLGVVDGVTCTGMVEDGDEMLWLNPTDTVVSILIGKLKFCCDSLKFDLTVENSCI